MKFLFMIFFSIKVIYANVEKPSILIFNQYDQDLIGTSVINHFTSKNFVKGENINPFLGSLDSLKNPASGRMSLVRDIGLDLNVDYILFHQISGDSNRFMLEGQMFNTRSGGLIKRRIVDITN